MTEFKGSVNPIYMKNNRQYDRTEEQKLIAREDVEFGEICTIVWKRRFRKYKEGDDSKKTFFVAYDFSKKGDILPDMVHSKNVLIVKRPR